MAIKTWEQFYAEPRTFPEMLRWGLTHAMLVTELTGHDEVLEVGTGTGMLSALLSKFCKHVVTIDNSVEVLHTAREFMSVVDARVLAIRGDAFKLPFGDDTFGACYSQGLLEHFSDAHVTSMVAEQLRVAPVVYASVPSAFYPHVRRLGPGLIGNERLLTLRRWRRLLSRWQVRGSYYADPKIASFAGRTLPWPAQILLRISPS